MNQGCRFLRSIIILSGLLILLLATFAACSRISPLPGESATNTPAQDDCYWNWAYGAGSEEFDDAVMQQLSDQEVESSVKSSTYGEIYSCDQSFSAMSLDVKLEIETADLGDTLALSQLADQASALLKENLPISGVSGLGNINLTFVLKDSSASCCWNFSTSLCE